MRLVFVLGFVLLSSKAIAGKVPLGLPDVPSVEAAHLTEKQNLGKRLFMDRSLSSDGTISCSSCHLPDKAFADGLTTGKGIHDQRSYRNTPSLFNVVYVKDLFWDGRSSSLEAQLLGPFTNPKEHGLGSANSVVEKVKANPAYTSAFVSLYGAESEKWALGIADIANAIACYERTLLSGNSAFDRYYYGKDRAALSASAERGFALFTGRAGCSSCHLVGAHSALFADQAFHRSPNPLPESVSRNLSALAQLVVATKRAGDIAIDTLTTQNPDVAELGRFLVTLDPADIGTFRTPSLRNVALTAPYMHDGSIPTLEAVIDAELYVRGASGNYPIALSADERGDLLEFLKSLTGTTGSD